MNRIQRRDSLPTYHEVLQDEIILERRLWCLRISGVSFLISDILISLLAFGGFFLIYLTDTFTAYKRDVKPYCNDTRYNMTPLTASSNLHIYISMISMIGICVVLSAIKIKIETGKFKKAIKNGLWLFWIIGMNSIVLYIFVEFIKCAAGVPRPYFFSESTLKEHYCDDNHDKKLMSIFYEKLNDEYRKSFPSRRAAFSFFSSTFLYLSIGHFDIKVGLRASQHLLLLLMWPSTCYFLARSWENGENHIEDILAGALIGIFIAINAIRSIYGKVFSTPPVEPVKRDRSNNYQPTAPPEEEIIDDVTRMIPTTANNTNNMVQNRSNNMRSYESSQTLRINETTVYTMIERESDKSDDEDDEVRINITEFNNGPANNRAVTTTV